MSVRERIGSLADRLENRLGRSFGSCRTCDRPTRSHRLGTGVQCHRCHSSGERVALTDGGDPPVDEYDFENPEEGVWNQERLECEQWMVADEGKRPFAPWGDPNAPAVCNHEDHDETTTCDVCEHDARRKWSYHDNYRDGQSAILTSVDQRFISPCFLQTEDDVYAYLDGDDVRDPDTGDVHPVFLAFLEHLGATYVDISQSGRGVHAIFKGELPEGVKSAKWEIDDEPWGANDEVPSVEIYDTKRVCVETGKHVPGSPLEVNEWNDDALYAILDANDQIKRAPETQSVDLSDYEPSATKSTDTTDDIHDVLYAIDRIDARDVAEKTVVYRWNDSVSTSGSKRAFYPVWGKRSNGRANIVGPDIWQDTGSSGGYGGPTTMAAIALGEVGHTNVRPHEVEGHTWWKAVDHLRELGFQIPYYEPPEDEPYERDGDYVAAMPNNDTLDRLGDGWDWKHASQNEFGDSILHDVRERTQTTLEHCFEGFSNRLVHALPATGKTTGSVRACAETDVPVTFLTGRGVDEQYEKVRSVCDEYGVKAYTLPAFQRDCPCAQGEHGETVQDRVLEAHRHGATPKQVHAMYESRYDEPIPCKIGQECPYVAKWDFHPDDYDMLIGHYHHANVPKVSVGRAVAIDEFADEYVDKWEGIPETAISLWLESEDAMPIDTYAELMSIRGGGTTDTDRKRADALSFFSDGVETAPEQAFEPGGHAKAPMLVFVLLASSANDLGNGWERARFPGRDDKRIGVYNGKDNTVAIVNPPDWTYARSVTALDGTPTKTMWEDVLGIRLKHERVLTRGEKQHFVEDGLNLNIVRTTDAQKPYLSGTYVNVEQDATLMEWISKELGDFGLISSRSAIEQYDAAGLDHLYTEGSRYYGNLLGSNDFANTRVGCVIGSTNFGDDYVKMWGAIHNERVEANRNPEQCEGRGSDLSYGVYGDHILTHMREHQTLQAIMRFGRDGRGAAVFVHTNTLPEWVPHQTGMVVKSYTDGEKKVINALGRLDIDDGIRTAAVAEEAGMSPRQTLRILTELRERGYLDAETEAKGFIWRDDGLHRISENGSVECDVELDDLTVEEAGDISRTTTYYIKRLEKHLSRSSWESKSGSELGHGEINDPVDDDPPPD